LDSEADNQGGEAIHKLPKVLRDNIVKALMMEIRMYLPLRSKCTHYTKLLDTEHQAESKEANQLTRRGMAEGHGEAALIL